MELFSAEFLSALLAIIVIDLVLAGDNAIVIALAARGLPPDLRKRAIIWGTFGAIAVRTAMTLIVVWLLKIPGLMLLGGALLVWIAYRLLADNDDGGHEVSPASSFWGAMKTIIVADAVMGLDNVLAVAGAAQGSFLLVVIGLLISIPIVIWGSQIILKYVERYPGIIYVGGAVLAWTAAKMITSEPLVKDHFAAYPGLAGLLYIAIIGGVLGGGFWINHVPARKRVAGHVVEPGVAALAPAAAGVTRILLPVDASTNSLQAVEHVIGRHAAGAALEVHLLHVRVPFSQYIARFVSRRDHEAYHRQEAERALAPARTLLSRAGVPHADHVEFGDKAETIRGVAERLGVNQIVMGTARKNSLTRVLEDSVTSRVLEIVDVPVEIVVGRAVSRIDTIGLPAGVSAVAAVLIAVSLQ
ncbi:MAG: YjbE family putative metal transport protein [Burkholderiales bacterium]|nr:YjbE family putative metal transport protein [Burkholderiales bacterium]